MGILDIFRKKLLLTGFVYRAWKHEGWGDRIQWSNYDERRVVGWLQRIPDVGDEIQFKMQSGKVARFGVLKVERAWNVDDMFFADVMDIGYVDERPINPVTEAKEHMFDRQPGIHFLR